VEPAAPAAAGPARMEVEGTPRRRVTKKQKIDAQPPLGRIENLVLENFKSYEGVHSIGPFDKFTCIIGPNGSGKSNVMDAISFCLGIRAKHLRGDRLKDLIYRREEEDSDANTRSASVTLEFRAPDGDLLKFTRTINARGTGAYLYASGGNPPKSVTYEELLKLLGDQQIHVKARNFLVFQGDVMELARRQGSDLTGVLETISGSDQLKEQYERLSRELEMTQERARMHFQHRREIESTVSALGKQRAEVDRYQELRNRRNTLVLEAVLFKLYCAERETERCHEGTEELKAAVKRAEDEFRSAKQDVDQLEDARRKHEQDAEETKTKYFMMSSNLQQIQTEITACEKQAVLLATKLKDKEKKTTVEKRQRKAWEQDANHARDEREKVEMEIERLKSKDLPSAVVMTIEQKTEYEQAVAKTDAANSKAREQHREAEELLRINVRELQNDKKEFKAAQDSKDACTVKLGELAHEMEKLQLEAVEKQGALEGQRAKAEQIGSEVQKFLLFRDSLLEEQRGLKFKLDSAKARREKLEHLEAKQRIADELRDAFPKGVLGRISELVLPTQKRFDLPLQQSLGNMAEAFVVSDAQTARDCVQYLKTKRISTETFLPLDRMVPPQVGALHLITDGYDARRLATMCVQHNERFLERHQSWQANGRAAIDKTLAFLLAGTIIVDDLKEAKATAYKDARARNLMPRVVTLQGEVISPNGNMMVQSSSTAGRVEFGGAEQLHEIRQQETKLVQVDRDLASLQEELSRTQRQEVDARELAALSLERWTMLDHQTRDVRANQKLEERVHETKITKIKELEKKIDKMEKYTVTLEKQVSQLEEELLKAGKKHFTKLNRSLGVDDVREILQKETKERRKLRDKVEECETLVRTIANKEKALTNRMNAVSQLAELQRDCEQYKKEVEGEKQRQHELEERSATLAAQVDPIKAKVEELNAKKEQSTSDAKNRRIEMQRAKAKADEMRKKQKTHLEKVQVILSIRIGIFRDCNERSMEIPMVKDGGQILQKVLARARDLDEIPLEELDAASRGAIVDYAGLPQERMELAAQTRVYDSRAAEAEYEAHLAEIQKELDALTPNMRAIEQYSAEEGRLKEVRSQADEASTETQRLTREFEKVKAERTSKFMACFKHVESCVHPFYKGLTSYDGSEGGSAYLDLDDAEEPYNGGITFTACPPGKRFFPMELLSGGERSMASMALLFAMHSYKPPPFMILDEVDAPFDRKNTNALVSYLRTLHFQCLVISLKDTFFSNSDTLVGIFKDKEIQSSGSLSLPLRRLGEESATQNEENDFD